MTKFDYAITVGGSINRNKGKVSGAIDLTVGDRQGRKRAHRIDMELNLDEARQLIDDIQNQVNEVQFRVNSGVWLYELDDIPADSEMGKLRDQIKELQINKPGSAELKVLLRAMQDHVFLAAQLKETMEKSFIK